MRFVCAILLVFVLLMWRVEAGALPAAYPRATMTPASVPTFAPVTPAPGEPYPYPAPQFTPPRTRVFLPVVSR